MSTTLYIAPPGSRDGTETLFREIVSRSPDNNFSGILYLGPNAPYLASIKRQFFSYVKKKLKKSAYIPFETWTIKELALNLYRSEGQLEVVSDEIRTLILLRVSSEKNLGYATLLSELYSKIKHYITDLTLADVKNEISKLIMEEKARERALGSVDILQEYEEKLREKRLTDSEGILGACTDLIREHLKPSLLVVDGFFDPTPLEMEIISELINNAGGAILLAEENTSLAGLSAKGSAFKTVKLKSPPKRNAGGYVQYSSLEEEVEGIVKSIKKLLMDGTLPWEVTVSFPELSKYAAMFTRVCKKHGVPVSVSAYTEAVSRPVIVLSECITCIEEDYPRNDFLSLLTSPFLASIPDAVREWAVSFSYRAGIIKGKDAWLSIEKTLNNASQEISEHESLVIAEFQKGINRVIGVLEKVRNQRGLASFIDAFESALDSLGFAPSGREEPDASTDNSSRLDKVFSELRQFADHFKSARKLDGSPGFYLRYLLEGITEEEPAPGGVRVIPFQLAASIETKELFFGGMIEGDVPSKPGIDPILPEQVKKALGLPYLEYYLSRQQKYFDRLLNRSEHAPRFSCPAADGEKMFLPSPFLDWDQKQEPVEWKIYSDEEILIREGTLEFRRADSRYLLYSNNTLSGAAAAHIQKKFKGSINVTDIDYYRKCPFRFYIEKVLGMEIEEPPRYEVEARLWGSLAHRVMEYLFREGDTDIEDLGNRIFNALESGLQQFPVGDFWSGVAKDIFKRLLPGLKELERERQSQGYHPWKVEQKFSAEINGVRLKGKIDRVDIKKQESGVTSDETTVRIIDYKTGTIDRDSLQLPLYAFLWKQNNSEPIDKLGYYSLKEARISWYPGKKGMDEYLRSTLDTVETLVRNMRNGHFPPEPYKATECRYCGHGPLCDGSR